MRVSGGVGRARPTRSVAGSFLYCEACEAIHRISDVDSAPLVEDDGSAVPLDDRERFFRRHSGHDLSVLWRSSEAEILTHSRSDPMGRATWELTDGEHTYVVISEREDIESPRRYRVFPGRLILEKDRVELDAPLLARLLEEESRPSAIPADKIRSLVDTCRSEIAELPSDRFDAIDEDRHHPNVQLACLPDDVARKLQLRARDLFEPDLIDRLDDLLGHELRYNIPLVRIQRRVRVQTV